MEILEENSRESSPNPGISGNNPREPERVIKFSKYDESLWNPLFDEHRKKWQQIKVTVLADKGFYFSKPENCFVNLKRNHFQITCKIEALDAHKVKYIKDLRTYKMHEIETFLLKFKAIKAEMHSYNIQIIQSGSDRTTMPHTPVPLEIDERRITTVTVPRLHFDATTSNNRPNSEQKYFILLVCLHLRTKDGLDLVVQTYQSEKIIVWNRRHSLIQTEHPLNPELAVSKDIVDSFGPNGLIESIKEETTVTEEIVFQKVLRRKMVCDVCITHMKQFRCSKCLYSMCLDCKNTISRRVTWKVTCPHCRTRQKEFESIKLPRY